MSELPSSDNAPDGEQQVFKIYLKIQGEEIIVRSPSDNVDAIKKAAEAINAKINRLHRSQSNIPSHKLALMTALQICVDNYILKEKLAQVEKDLLEIKKTGNELSDLLRDGSHHPKVDTGYNSLN